MATKTKKGRGLEGFRPPAPRGVRLNAGAIPKSSRYVAPDVEADPTEEAAFTRLSDPGRPDRAGTRRGATPEQLGAARRRQQGLRDEAEHKDEDETEQDQEQDQDDADAQAEKQERRQMTRAQRSAEPAQPTPAPAQHPVSPFMRSAQHDPAITRTSVPDLTVRPIGVEDTDRLWDWIRADEDYGRAFLGRSFGTSMELHALMQAIVQGEAKGLSVIRAIQYGPHHLGFAMLAPILAEAQTALMHVYLRADVRGQLAEFVGPLVEAAQQIAPGTHLAVYSTSAALHRLHKQVLGPLGFVEHAMFVL